MSDYVNDYAYAVEVRPLGGDRIDIRFKVGGVWVSEIRNVVLVPGQDVTYILSEGSVLPTLYGEER